MRSHKTNKGYGTVYRRGKIRSSWSEATVENSGWLTLVSKKRNEVIHDFFVSVRKTVALLDPTQYHFFFFKGRFFMRSHKANKGCSIV